MTGKARQKLGFKHFFFKRLIPLLIAGTLLCVIGTIAIGSMVWANYETMCSFEFASTKAAILEDNCKHFCCIACGTICNNCYRLFHTVLIRCVKNLF